MTEPAITIRRATPDDADRIGEMWEQLARYHHQIDSRLPDAAANGALLYAQRILNRLNDSHTCTLVAERDGEVVGYVLGVIVDMVPEMFVQAKGGFLADIYVEPSARQKGVGRALVQTLSEWFRARGASYYEWSVAASNPAGRAFWQAMGGREVMLRLRADLQQDENEPD